MRIFADRFSLEQLILMTNKLSKIGVAGSYRYDLSCLIVSHFKNSKI